MIRKLLIANRGEIAVRVIRAAREMGIRTVAVYSESDKNAMHVALADESVSIGGSMPSESYLSIEKVIGAAKHTRAEAIHPGYGFLSERAEFSEACADAGIVFVGPSASAMQRLGSKSEAKALAVQEAVPIVPGCFDLNAGPTDLKLAAEQIGYPIMLKASAGGGGRGMREVRDPADFERELSAASHEAFMAFGDGAMMVEKLVDRPRHIEVQILADTHGQVVCLFERECSLQRRHQKLIEEAPSPYLANHAEMWREMAAASRRLAVGAGYVGAGTVEFMVDESEGKFYFLEVNARLQVEHPVTEAVTSLDLVKWQLRIASGERLDLDTRFETGDRGSLSGHAIEARIVAEDPATGFTPSIGRVLAWAEPKAPGIRVDTGFGPNSEVSRYYDSLLAKVIAYGETRLQAIEKLKAALLDFHILGVKTNIGYVLDVLDHPDFKAGKIDTGFLGREFGDWSPGSVPEVLDSILKHAPVLQTSTSQAPRLAGVWDANDRFRNSSSTG